MVEYTVPQIMMTLSAIAYTAPKESILETALKGQRNPTAAELEANLACEDYATKGQWKLVWGPANSPEFDNMMFVVRHEDTATCALVLRGTVFDDLASWREDIPTDQKRFDAWTGGTETWVANGFYDGFDLMLRSTSEGPAEGQTLAAFLAGEAAQNPEMTVYVTGHSQGAGLMPLFLAWLNAQIQNWSTHLTTAGYGYAPPTAGDAHFAAWVEANADSRLYVNPLDLVPFGYASIDRVIPDHIPTDVPELLHPVIDLAAHAARDAAMKGGGSWAQSGKVTNLDGKRQSGGYFHEIAYQHGHNTYLALLGAPPTQIVPPHFCAKS